ncbi:major facilitator superfamily domain-containing protein [Xylariomycetidae sp. FL2044]|nr:major facilitator superfamily domain-containing protein [Xylariomycetidae sp. FL2044]
MVSDSGRKDEKGATGPREQPMQSATDRPSGSEQEQSGATENEVSAELRFERGLRFWTIIVILGISGLLGSLEHTVVVTSGPYILQDLDLREEFVWITNGFFVTSTAVTPLLGQLCNIFGRRWVFLATVAFNTLGSGICGGATSADMLIAGRAIQGAGSGGIVLIINIIVSDLCPLRYRGRYFAVILAIYGFGLAVGPLLGGVIAEYSTWRWVFYMSLPIGGFSLASMFFLLRYDTVDNTTMAQKLRRLDLIGNAILPTSTVSILYALTYAGTIYSWGSWYTLVPLILGFFGFFVFGLYEASGHPVEPVMPMRLLLHRTSIIVFINTWVNSVMYLWFLYFLSIYFQAVALYSATRAGYSLFPQAVAGGPASIAAGILLSRTGKFKALHFAGFAFCAVGMGISSLLDEHVSAVLWAACQIIMAIGIGFVVDTLPPAFQAPVSEDDQASATSCWAFMRSFGGIWGVEKKQDISMRYWCLERPRSCAYFCAISRLRWKYCCCCCRRLCLPMIDQRRRTQPGDARGGNKAATAWETSGSR